MTKFKTKTVVLDGNNNFISVSVTNLDKSRELYPLLLHKDAEDMMKFTNIEAAKLAARKILDSSKSVEYYFNIGNTIININDTQKINGAYEYYDDNRRIKFYIKDTVTHRLIKAGYIVFEHGNEKFSDKEYGIRRQQELAEWIDGIIIKNIRNSGVVGIESKKKISSKETVLKIKDSTAKIHILTNSGLMDINQSRKENNQKCIPYLKNMDKYTTFCVYCTKDIQERIYFNTDKKVIEILTYIITELRNSLPGTSLDEINPSWIETEFAGYVTFNEKNK
jgi:hypothetical protein